MSVMKTIIMMTGEGSPPAAPTITSVANWFGSNIQVIFSLSSGATSYDLEISINSGGFVSFGSTASSPYVGNPSLLGAVNTDTLEVRMTASNAFGTSGYSNTDSVVYDG